MIIMASLGLLLGLSTLGMRFLSQREKFRERAKHHARWEVTSRSMEREDGELATSIETNIKRGWLTSRKEHYQEMVKLKRASAARASLNADYHSAMKRKYERAALRPWIVVEPDPEMPEL